MTPAPDAAPPDDGGSPTKDVEARSEAREVAATAGRNELGSVTFADSVVEKIAARAAIEIADAGGSAPRLLGKVLPGAAHLGVRTTSLDTLPKTAADVDGSMTTIQLEMSVRWPASIASTTAAVRTRVQQRVTELTGLTVSEIRITVTDLVTHLAPPPRVR